MIDFIITDVQANRCEEPSRFMLFYYYYMDWSHDGHWQ